MTCCNQNCNQGRTCPEGNVMKNTTVDLLSYAAAIVWVVVGVFIYIEYMYGV